MYTLYTTSHKQLFTNWFSKTLDKNDYELVEKNLGDMGEGRFKDMGWSASIKEKIKLIIQAIEENQEKVFVFSDVDIQFFGPTKELLLKSIKNKDIICARDGWDMCLNSGFFACVGNAKTLRLWNEIERFFNANPQCTDQTGLIHVIHKKKVKGLKVGVLPLTFYCPKTPWSPGIKIDVPQKVVMHHANWTEDVESKIDQLVSIRDTIESGRGVSIFKYGFKYWFIQRPLFLIRKAKQFLIKRIKKRFSLFIQGVI